MSEADDANLFMSEAEERGLQEDYRNQVRRFDGIEADLRASQTFQKIYALCLTGGITLTFLLGYTVIVGLWQTQPVFTRWAGLIIVNFLWIAMGWAIWKNRKKVVDLTGALRNALQDRQTSAAKLPLDSPSGLRIYREASLDLIDQYRQGANKNRRIHNLFQVMIISGSIVTSTLTAMNEGGSLVLRISTSALSAIVGVSAGITGYFKFRERGYNLQSTADDIEKHYNASQFMLDEYAGTDAASPLSEKDRLRLFARYVERLKEEQRKRELQLEQSSSASEERAN
ncbi:DUF4231 domain-containing protein [Streptomyces sp. SID3212]|uniref:DUF4231 domain-containing protein n=1 Tax=Streptomyces sp. SID3212 TaxID=2690259 RepID=UPI00136C5EDC|nr:DUF4231 domain-containing protein [Streptomyces sp. SID3212]MYV53001.1 DUF4231 domain-containing protein [Streptomyces sp. SID3212]